MTRAEVLEIAQTWRVRILLALTVAVPAVFLRVLSDPINVPKFAILIVGVSAAAGLKAVELLQGAPSNGLRRVWIPATVVVGALFASWIFSSYRGWSLIGEYHRLQGLLPYAIGALFGVLVADAFAGRSRDLAWAVTAGGGLVGGYACLQYVHLDPFSWSAYGDIQRAATSTLGNTDFTGGFLAICLPVVLVLAFTEREHRWLPIALAGVIGVGCLVTFSQGAWVAGVAGVVLTAGYLTAERWRFAPIAAAVAVIAIAAGIVGLVALSATERGSSIAPVTVSYRGEWAHQALLMGNDSPLVGTGPNTFALRGVHYRSLQDAIDFGYTYTDDPHSVPGALYANAGILGFVAFAILVMWVAAQHRRIRGNPFAAAFMGAASAYIVQSLVSIDELSLRVAFWAVAGGLAAAIATRDASAAQSAGDRPAPPRSSGGKRKKSRKREVQPIRYPAAIAVVGIVVLLATWWSLSYVVADARFLQATQLLNEGKLDEAQHQYQLAVGFRPDPDYRLRYGARLGNLLVGAGEPAAPIFPRVTSAFGFLESTPTEIGLVDFADILDRWSDVDPSAERRSAAIYSRAIALDPVNPSIRLSIAPVYISIGDYDRALEALAPINGSVAERFHLVWGLRALAEARLGDRSNAMADAQHALSIDPKDTNALAALRILRKASG